MVILGIRILVVSAGTSIVKEALLKSIPTNENACYDGT